MNENNFVPDPSDLLPCTVKNCPCGNLGTVIIKQKNGRPTPLHIRG